MDNPKKFRLIVATMAVMVLFAGQASASFKSCFTGCAISCLFGENKILCVLKCFPKCLLGEGFSELNYCKLGCAVDQCAPLANEYFSIGDVEKVDRCVNECEISQCSLFAQLAAGSELPSYERVSPVGAPSPRNTISD